DVQVPLTDEADVLVIADARGAEKGEGRASRVTRDDLRELHVVHAERSAHVVRLRPGLAAVPGHRDLRGARRAVDGLAGVDAILPAEEHRAVLVRVDRGVALVRVVRARHLADVPGHAGVLADRQRRSTAEELRVRQVAGGRNTAAALVG